MCSDSALSSDSGIVLKASARAAAALFAISQIGPRVLPSGVCDFLSHTWRSGNNMKQDAIDNLKVNKSSLNGAFVDLLWLN